MRAAPALALLGVAALAAAQPAHAQAGEAARRLAPYDQAVEQRVPLAPPLLSLALPGAGQHLLGQKRKWAYLALEVAAWTLYFERRSSGGGYRDRYRDYAWDYARLQLGPRVDGDFAYYETMSKWPTSGAFDADAQIAGTQPEQDLSTYNGSIWALATGIFLPGGTPVPESDPAYQAALAYYQERAYGATMLWDWTGAPSGRQELGRLIEASDHRFRQATTALGVVIANHLLSAGDAYLAARGRTMPARIRLIPARSGAPGAWSAQVTLAVGG